MGYQRVGFAGGLLVFLAATFAALVIPGCVAHSRLPYTPIISGYTLRQHASVSLPAFAPNGDKFIVNGPYLWRYSPENELLQETLIELPESWNGNENSTRIFVGPYGNLFLDMGDGLAWIRDSGEIIWNADVSLVGKPLFIPGGGLLMLDKPEVNMFLTRINTRGEQEWGRSIGLGSIDTTSMMLDNGQVYVLQQDHLTAWDIDGTILWRTRIDPRSADPYFLGSLENLPGFNNLNQLPCYGETGEGLGLPWVSEHPKTFVGDLPLSPNRIFVIYRSSYSGHRGLLILDGQGNKVGLLDNRAGNYGSTVDETRFVLLQQAGGEEYIRMFGSGYSEKLWGYTVPARIKRKTPKDNDIVDVYEGWEPPYFAPNGMIYFEVNSTLYELDQSGKLIASFHSKATWDTWVDTSPSALIEDSNNPPPGPPSIPERNNLPLPGL